MDSSGDVWHEGYDGGISIHSDFPWNTRRQTDFDSLGTSGTLKFVRQIRMVEPGGHSHFYSIFYAGLRTDQLLVLFELLDEYLLFDELHLNGGLGKAIVTTMLMNNRRHSLVDQEKPIALMDIISPTNMSQCVTSNRIVVMPSLVRTVDKNAASTLENDANDNTASTLENDVALTVGDKPKPKKNLTKAQLKKARMAEKRSAAPQSKADAAQKAEDRKTTRQLEISMRHKKEEAKKVAAAIPQLVCLISLST